MLIELKLTSGPGIIKKLELWEINFLVNILNKESHFLELEITGLLSNMTTSYFFSQNFFILGPYVGNGG